MKNFDIRSLVHERGLTFKAIASELGISREWMSRLMSKTLTVRNRDRIMQAIEALSQKGNTRNDI